MVTHTERMKAVYSQHRSGGLIEKMITKVKMTHTDYFGAGQEINRGECDNNVDTYECRASEQSKPASVVKVCLIEKIAGYL